MASNFPKPTPFVISQAVQSGLKIPAIEIDPWLNFVRGAYLFASDIDKLDMSFKTWRKPLIEARDFVIVPSIERNFAAQGRPPWKKLAPQTIKNRLYMGFPRGPILERTGRLQRIMTRKNIWDVISAVGREGVDMLMLRTEFVDQLVKYAYFHQFGAGTRRNRTLGFLSTRIGQTGKTRPGSGPTVGSGFSISRRAARPELGEDTRTFRLPPRPFLALQTEEEAEIYGIFYNFMSDQVDKHWGREEKGLSL